MENMKTELKNLLKLIDGEELNNYQKILVINEFSKLEKYINELKKSISNTFTVGDYVKIILCLNGHEFEIGEKVLIKTFEDNQYLAEDEEGYCWYITQEEAIKI